MTENTLETSRSILRNLQLILNTRLGQVPAQMDMGMPTPSEIVQASPDAVGLILKNLRSCIEKYEPRLASVEITHVQSEHDVPGAGFQLPGQVAGGGVVRGDHEPLPCATGPATPAVRRHTA